MGLKDIKKRLLKYQQETMQSRGITPVVADIIQEGRYYDELTPHEKEEVAGYWGTDRDTFEVVHGGIFNNCSLHLRIERKPLAPRNRKELNERIEELTAILDEAAAEYNSPESIAQREAEYQELQRLGELRKQDCLAGLDMDKEHPLPWAEKDFKARERWERFNLERRNP